jgi:hypothetical protein
MKRLLLATIVTLILLLFYDVFFVHSDHTYFKWQELKGFYALLGFFGSILLMFFSKFLGKFFLYRDDFYYKD